MPAALHRHRETRFAGLAEDRPTNGAAPPTTDLHLLRPETARNTTASIAKATARASGSGRTPATRASSTPTWSSTCRIGSTGPS